MLLDKVQDYLKAHWQISKKWYFGKYCWCDKACQFSVLYGTPWRSYLENTFLKKCRSSHPMQKQVYYKKTIVKKLAIFTEKHLCWSSFLTQSIAKSLRAAILKNICEWQLLKMCSWNHMMKLRKIKLVHKEF